MTASEGVVLAFVVNASFQATVVALAAMAAAVAARQAPAAVRQAIWMLALALAVAIPLRSTLVTVRTPPPSPSIALPASEAGPIAATKPAPVGHAVSAPARRLVLSRGVARALVGAYLLVLVLRVISLLRGWARASGCVRRRPPRCRRRGRAGPSGARARSGSRARRSWSRGAWRARRRSARCVP